jgi:serine/threonine-protein kinase
MAATGVPKFLGRSIALFAASNSSRRLQREASKAMNGRSATAGNSLTVRQACDELSRRLRCGQASSAEEFLAAAPASDWTADAALELVYTEFVVREELGEQPRPEIWLDRFPQWRSELAQVFEVHSLVNNEQTILTGLSDPHQDVENTDDQRASFARDRLLGGYDVLQEIGRGGMGVVYRARQRGLGRIVALKMILPPHGERERARFRTEAEATARLSHPNIVPIYEVGQEGDCPFLSMEFVPGQSLDKRLAESLMAPRAAAELVLTLARAVAYAHEKGVIHRDLKPANILLAADGSPKITDFGLARQLRLADVPPDGQPEGLSSVAIVGTPSYMAPEQCQAGEPVSPAADVYSLGAILYEILTGRPLFRGQTVLDILELVRSQDPVPPRRLVPKVPRDLETICLKCLAKQPQHRYASAAALAEDLRRFLGSEPILARPVGRAEQALRWCQRNPVVAAMAGGIAAALLCGTIVFASLTVWAINEKTIAAGNARRADEHARRADDNATLARTSAQHEKTARELAEYRFAQAEKAVEDYLDGIENDERLKEADFFDLRKQLLASAVPFYEDFVQARPGDAALEAKRGRAYGRLALVRRQVGEYERAAADFRQMQAIFQKLAGEFPSVAQHRQELARSHHGLSAVLRSLGRQEEAVTAVRQAVALQEELVAAFPHVADYRQDLGKIRDTLGMLLRELGSYEAAAAEYQQAFALQRPLAAENPTNASYRYDLSRSYNNLANVLNSLGKQAEAADARRQGLALLQALAQEFPEVANYRHGLAMSHHNLGLLYTQLQQEAEAEVEYRQALALRKLLAEEYPTVPAYRFELARSYYALGRLLRTNRPVEAEVELRTALTLRIDLNAEVVGAPEYRSDLAESYAGLGSICRAQGKRDEALEGFQQAVHVWRPLLAEFPNLHTHRGTMASHLNSLALLLRGVGKLDQARSVHEEAVEHRRKLLEGSPTDRFHAASLVGYYRDFGDTIAVQKDHTGLAHVAGKLAQIRPSVAADSELAAKFLGRCVTLAEQDSALADDQRQTLARSYADQAIEHLQEAVRRGFKNVAALKTSAELAPLRDRSEFQQLIKELESP